MRADRLLAILMLLQARGQMTAQELAAECEVSERTIYRDMDALSGAGVPVYGVAGPAGGFALLDSYRTNLTGLTGSEVRALFMLSIPAPLADLGVSTELRTALLKLSAALPAVHRQDESWVRQRYHLDASWWRQGEERVPHLHTIHQAVVEDRRLHLVYRPLFTTKLERIVAPYGLVAKAGAWYVVCARAERIEAFRVSDLVDARLTDERFTRPAGFDLAAFWTAWCVDYETHLADFSVVVRVSPAFIPELPRYFGPAIHERIAQAERDGEGGIILTLSFPSFVAARDRLLGFGRGVRVVEPFALRRSIIDFAEQIIDLYASSTQAGVARA